LKSLLGNGGTLKFLQTVEETQGAPLRIGVAGNQIERNVERHGKNGTKRKEDTSDNGLNGGGKCWFWSWNTDEISTAIDGESDPWPEDAVR
jgi:hypothetical protein